MASKMMSRVGKNLLYIAVMQNNENLSEVICYKIAV